ncbi:hypothetical protein V6N13_042444 [Hibiscus sabdariffa]
MSQQKGGIRGSNNKFSVLTEAVALLSDEIKQDIVDVEEASVGEVVSRAIEGDSMLAAAVEVAVVAPESDALGVQQPGLAQVADGNADASVIAPMASPRKVKAASLGVARLVKDLKSKKKDLVEKGRRKDPVLGVGNSVSSSSIPPLL